MEFILSVALVITVDVLFAMKNKTDDVRDKLVDVYVDLVQERSNSSNKRQMSATLNAWYTREYNLKCAIRSVYRNLSYRNENLKELHEWVFHHDAINMPFVARVDGDYDDVK